MMDRDTLDPTQLCAEPSTPAPQADPQAMVRREKHEYASVLQELPLGVVGLDYEGRCTFLNRATGVFLAFDANQAIGTDIRQLVTDPAIRKTLDEAIRHSRDGIPVTREFRCHDRSIELRSSFTREADRLSSTILVLENVTWKREVDRRKDEFLALVSHELRTPLTIIKGYLDIFDHGMMGEMNAEQQDSTKLMLDQCTRLEELIQDLIRFRNLTRGVVETSPGPLAIEPFFRRIAAEFRPEVERFGMTFTVDVYAPEAACWCSVSHLSDAVRHLIDNATKFASEGRQLSIIVSRFDLGELPPVGERIIPRDPPAHTEWALIRVADRGPGIPHDKIREVFNTFEQVENHLTRRTRGLGMGLPMVKEIVDRSGGTLWVDTGENGTQVSFILPLIHPTAAHS